MSNMFCFQCEQTVQGTGCTGMAGVCGKSANTASLQDVLTGALIGLARAAGGNVSGSTCQVIIDGLFVTATNVNFDDAAIRIWIEKVRSEAAKFGAVKEYAMSDLWNADEDVRSLKSLLLLGVRGIAAYAHHASVLGYKNEEIGSFIARALTAVGESEYGMGELLPLVDEAGKVNLICMELLDKANTESYGNPKPVTVPLSIEKGPFIIISGHDLRDLKLLLEQTEGIRPTGIKWSCLAVFLTQCCVSRFNT